MAQQRLLEIAIDEFAMRGLYGASTRGIAAAAGTAMSSITYHYGSKEGLYLAAADYLAGQMEDFRAEYDTDAIVRAGDAARAHAAIKAMLGRLVDKLASRESDSWSKFIIREQMSPTDAFDRIYDGPMGRMMEALVELVRTATGIDDRQAARIAVLTLFGQVMVLRAARATCDRLIGGDCADVDFVGQFRARVASNIDVILQSLAIDNRVTA